MPASNKIMLIDDDRNFLESNRELLEACGYEVQTAFDGESGLELARCMRPDLIILDAMMRTEMEGFETARKIAADPALQQARVIMLTGVSAAMHLPFDLEPDEQWLPVHRILDKPIAPSLLIAEIEKALRC
ncbi:MAG: two-component system response regulator [Kiritimatiellia bacterium]|nr:response regulator [Lentisphaerota bacterium]